MDKEIIYAADPMCSWCYGFAPVLQKIRAAYADRVPVSLTVGGLYAGNKMPLMENQRRWVLHHWQDVHQRTGQPFNFEFKLPEGFAYNTEPACRAVVAIRKLRAELDYPYFSALQRGFYVNNHDLTRVDVLADIATEFDIDRETFLAGFDSPEANEATQEDFTFCRRFGVDGFPALLLRDVYQYDRLSHGYRDFAELKPKIDAWLEQSST